MEWRNQYWYFIPLIIIGLLATASFGFWHYTSQANAQAEQPAAGNGQRTLYLPIMAMGDSTLRVSDPTPATNPEEIRIVPRRGIAPAYHSHISEQLVQLADWSYRWAPYNGNYDIGHEVVPMLAWADRLPSIETIQEIDRKTDLSTGHNYWLLFNECEAWQQCNRTPEEQALFYGNVVLPLMAEADPDAQMIIGGSISNRRGLRWMTRFVKAYRQEFGEEPPRAGWHFHIYPEVESTVTIENYIHDAEIFKRWVEVHGAPDDEIWLTEMGCLVDTNCPDLEQYVADILAYLEGPDGQWITRYAWFTSYNPVTCETCGYSPATFLVEEQAPHNLTELGHFYANYDPYPNPDRTDLTLPPPEK